MRLLCLLALLLLPVLLTERGAAQYEWNQRAVRSPPGARGGHAVAYDAARRRTVLFGGAGSNGIALSDTWEWDGTRWTRSFPAQSPPPRSGCAMAYDSGRGRVVLFGGRADSG